MIKSANTLCLFSDRRIGRNEVHAHNAALDLVGFGCGFTYAADNERMARARLDQVETRFPSATYAKPLNLLPNIPRKNWE